MFFIAALGSEQVGPGERHWTVTIPITGLAAGNYTIEGWLTTLGERPRFSASSGFEIAP